jgi:serine/threonine-protein kinase
MEQTKIPGRYRLIAEVGQGGMAVVFRAQDQTLKREVAIKVLHHHLASEPESKARLEREAQAVAKLRHENILEIFDYSGTASESAFIVTEFIDGRTLKDVLAARPIRHPEVAALIAAEVGGALAHAHSVGIIHRDLKPDNVMIRKDGLLKLMDFGIAQVVDLQRMTVTGQLLGSPAYMAPELIEGKPLDFRTDVFSLGIMLYQMATGTLPFAGKNPHEVLRRIGDGKFPEPRSLNRLIGDGLGRVMKRALARNPDDRYPDVSRFVADLTADLGEAGLRDVRGELRAFFTDPEGYDAALAPRLTAALIAAADRQLGERKTGRAMELWNRVLAIDPGNAEVLAALRRLEGRHRRRTVALAAGGVAAAALAIWALAPVARPGRDAAAAPTVAVAAAKPAALPAPPPAVVTAPGAEAAPVRAEAPVAPAVQVASADGKPPARTAPAHGGARDAGRGAAVSPLAANRRLVRAAMAAPAAARPYAPAAPAAAPPERVFTLGPTPQNVDVYLDGARQFAYDTDHKTISVPWHGNHVIELRSPAGCCFSEKIEVGPDRPLPPENIIARKLKWKPARVSITTDPAVAEARVVIKDPGQAGSGTLARPGEDIAIPFFPSDERSKEIEVDVDSGESFISERITVRAGQRSSHVIKLKTNN